MIRFDCRQVTGVIEKPRVIGTAQGVMTARIVIDGQVLPNVLLPGMIFEEIEAGERVTLYGIFTKKKDKTANTATIYAMKGENGKLVAARQYQIKVPVMLMVYSVPLMILAFIAGCFLSPYPIHLVSGSVDPDYLVRTTFVWAFWEGILAGLVMVGIAINWIRMSNDPESWAAIDAASLSQRFSKAFK
ncbi:hypothetical protein DMX03_16630 [Pseudomonas koreensis]|uniref:Uncharacterized protein n=1 Tax=Pseudomonas iranensis TaxID=2745503 RepID=A0AAU7F0H1_9PSED|nr:hypothetical protein DMX03_16630 [Pseudomonas koreensis]PYB97928.1 hypothetical protein DMX04_20165 [Pseudomonas koreensis]